MANKKKSDNLGKNELSHYSFIVGVFVFVISLVFGKGLLKKLVSRFFRGDTCE